MSNLKALPVKIPEEIYNKLTALANKTHRTKTFYVREALINYLEDLEDTHYALHALKEPGKNYSIAEVVKDMNLTEEELKDIGMED